VKSEIEQPGYPSRQQQHQRIDHEDEKTESDDQEWNRQQRQQRPDARIQHAEHEGHDEERPPAAVMIDPVDELNGTPMPPQDEQPQHVYVKYYRRGSQGSFTGGRNHAASTTVCSPFGWGLDWIEPNGHAPDAPDRSPGWASPPPTAFGSETPDTTNTFTAGRTRHREGFRAMTTPIGEQHGARA
jgi:hypothetical protein